MTDRPWSIVPQGVVVAVRLTPRSAKDQIDGVQSLSDGRAVVAARVRAVPEDGRANDALLKLMAKALDVRASDCTLAAGGKSRLKSVSIAGDPEVLAHRLGSLFVHAKG